MTTARATTPRLRVALIFGGRSTEHAISCMSAASVLRAIDRERYDVVPLGITTDGRWVLAPDDADRLAIGEGELPHVDPTGAAVVLAGDPTVDGLVALTAGEASHRLAAVDVVLPLLHGPYGEDGTMQGLLELAGVPYVGSGVLASAVSMDKEFMKAVLAARGFTVGPYVVIRPREWEADRAAALASLAPLGFPVFVKPARGGSSIGITKVTSYDGLVAAVEEARLSDPKVIVEAMVAGREIECGVLEGTDGAAPEASLPAEIRVGGGHDWYDFTAKYLDDVTEFDLPADLGGATTAAVRAMACAAFDAMACEGLARVDFFLTPQGELVVNEVNTMPGFTPASMFPRMWAATGVDYPALVDRLLATALQRRSGLR
ncbi:MAG: D-alanine--D-alanine ligase [Frankiales bacterium]|nr:D-alanine--D-alanine ligase [Frankiales bacterium]